jgi:hypothetical protein
MAKKYFVDLSKDEKAELVSLSQKGRPGARKIKRANILLLVDSGKPEFEVAELLHTSWLTVLRTRQRYVEGGLDFTLNELPRAGRLPKSTTRSRRSLPLYPKATPQMGACVGRCNCSPVVWLRSPGWRAFRMRRCAWC